jgi:hypothetical protein
VHTGQQLFEIEWFGDVIIRAKLQPAQLVALLTFGGQKNDRGALIFAPTLDQLKAALAGQIDVEQHEVGRKRLRGAGRRVAVRDTLHVEAFERQIVVKDPRQHGIVLHHEHTLLHMTHVRLKPDTTYGVTTR